MVERWENRDRLGNESEWFWLVRFPDGMGALLTERDISRGRERWEREGRPGGKVKYTQLLSKELSRFKNASFLDRLKFLFTKKI